MLHIRRLPPSRDPCFEPERDTENIKVSSSLNNSNFILSISVRRVFCHSAAFCHSTRTIDDNLSVLLTYFQLVRASLNDCLKIAPEELCLQTVFNSDYFWSK